VTTAVKVNYVFLSRTRIAILRFCSTMLEPSKHVWLYIACPHLYNRNKRMTAGFIVDRSGRGASRDVLS